jgi:hypothetical protein
MRKMIVLFIVLMLSTGVPPVLAEHEPLDVSGAYPNAKFTYQTMEEGKILLSVTDADEKPILGLTRDELMIRKGARTAQIVSVEPTGDQPGGTSAHRAGGGQLILHAIAQRH